MDEVLLATYMYLLATWANIILLAENNEESAAEVTARTLRTLFENRGWVINKS